MLICVYTAFQVLGTRFCTCSSVKPCQEFEEFSEILGLPLKFWNASGHIIFMILFSFEKTFWSTRGGRKITEEKYISP